MTTRTNSGIIVNSYRFKVGEYPLGVLHHVQQKILDGWMDSEMDTSHGY